MRVPDVTARSGDGVLLKSGSPAGGYLETFNLYRILACAAVLGQHAFIWTNMTGNVVGTGFITILHLSRNSFFFLTGLVVCYAQLNHPRSRGAFWRRRYWELGVPYLAWTGIYLVFSLITVNPSWVEVGRFLRHNLLLGYSQMYFVAVIFQFYLVFPFLMRLLQRTRRHGLVMLASLAFALLIGLFLHEPSWFAPLSDVNHPINSVLPWGRNILVDQEFLIAGVLVALHLDQVLDFVARRYRQIWLVTSVVGLLTVLWYVFSVRSGGSLGVASDIYDPSATLWSFAAMASLVALGWWWEQRERETTGPSPRRSFPSAAYWAGLTGGIFFAHTLFIEIIRSILDATGLRNTLPWEVVVAILFVGTVTITAAFVSLVLRTPLRWILGGPVRSEQRDSYLARPGLERNAVAPR